MLEYVYPLFATIMMLIGFTFWESRGIANIMIKTTLGLGTLWSLLETAIALGYVIKVS